MEHGPLAIALNAAWMQFYHGGVSHPLSYLCDPSGLGTFIVRSDFRTDHDRHSHES